MADFEGEEEEEKGSDKEEKEQNEEVEEIGDETSREVGKDTSSREETRIEWGNDAPPTLLERGSHSATTCK